MLGSLAQPACAASVEKKLCDQSQERRRPASPIKRGSILLSQGNGVELAKALRETQTGVSHQESAGGAGKGHYPEPK
jgi:hypothetical protein